MKNSSNQGYKFELLKFRLYILNTKSHIYTHLSLIMDSDNLFFNHQFSVTNMLISLFACVLYYLLAWRPTRSTLKKNTKSSKDQAPQPAGSWPVIGHLHLLHGSNPLHVALGSMADEYGPAFTIRIGVHRTLVVSSWEVAKECFTTNNKVFVSRPRQAAGKHMGYNNAMLRFASDTPYWTQIRKMLKRDLLSNSRLKLLNRAWHSEINTSITELYETNWSTGQNNDQGRRQPVLVDMKQWLGDLTLNMSVKMIAGKRCFGSDVSAFHEAEAIGKCQKVLRDFVRLMGQMVISDALPFLSGLDLDGHESEMKRAGKELDRLLGGWLEEHKQKKLSSSSGHEVGAENDWMDLMLSVLEDGKLSDYYDADTINKATCLALLQGGSIWTMLTLLWAFALLVNNADVMKKAHEELDKHVGRNRQVEESDIKNLSYLQAIVKEAMRLYPVSMRLLESTEDCTVAGYHVPARTRLIVNTWKIQRDPTVWSNPSKFEPERFLTDRHMHMDLKGLHFEITPFGSGIRSCPGSSLGLQMVELTIARLLHGFEFKTPSNVPIDMKESVGVDNMVKETPIEVLLTPRLPDEVYVSYNQEN